MVYPKHQVLPPSPRKKARATSSTTTDLKYSSTNMPSTTTGTTASLPASIGESHEANALPLLYDMLENVNTMIAMNSSSIRSIEEANANSTAAMNKKFMTLLYSINAIESRLNKIEDQAKKNTKCIEGLNQAVDTTINAVDVLERCIGSVESRVYNIERLIIRSKKRKRNQAARQDL